MFCTVYALFYGKYFDLHKRLIDSLMKYLPPGEARVVCWANTVRQETLNELYKLRDHFGASSMVIDSKENVPKYIAMRKMYHEVAKPDTDWILWLDDDTYIVKKDWWKRTKDFLQSTPDACYVGQKWYVHHLDGQWDFIKASKWFQGLEPELLGTKTPGVMKPGVWFMTGGYVWLRTCLMENLNWPDPRLSHNGGDTLLGEAVRQFGLPRHHYDYGVAVNKARRRGLSESPAGAKNTNFRR